MDSDLGKLFIGGISWETTEEKLKDYFGNYGDVLQTVIMRDKITGRPRGFGFVAFSDPSVLDRILQEKHTIDGRAVEAKRALSREEQHTSSRTGNPTPGRSFGGGGGGGGGSVRTKKIFVGGLPPTLSEEGFRSYFEQYGSVTDVVVMYDQSTQRPRGFGFISFDSEDAVERVLHKSFHELNGKMVEVKRALPKDASPGNGGGRSAGGGGGGYQGYNGSGMNAGSYDGRIDASRYVQPAAAGGGFSAYGSSGYGAPSYGYGSANNGSVGYGGYGVSGYGGAPAGGYGNPAAVGAGYMSGPLGAPRSPWNSQGPSGYGIQGAAAGYGANTGYGAGAAWSAAAAGGGTGTAPTGQSPAGGVGYGNPGYGYGYGANEGSYVNQSGYGAVGGRASSVPSSNAGGEQAGANTGYTGSGYGDANGNSGYPNAGWRSDPSQGGGYGAQQANGTPGGQVGYVGGYGAQTRQSQQQ